MLTVAQKLFSGNGARSGGNATRNVAALRSMVPFILPSVVSRTQPTHCGRGMIVPVTGKKNTPIVVQHNMGRMVQGMWPLLNNGGGSFAPKLMFDPTASPTLAQQTIIADEDLVQCLILFF